MLHRRDEEHGRLGDAHGEAEDDHRDARPADEAHGVADDMLRGFGYFLEVHRATRRTAQVIKLQANEVFTVLRPLGVDKYRCAARR